MIEQEDVKTVVMLCNIEKGFTGCSQYFPSTEGETQTHGAFRLSNTQTLPQDDLTLRDIELQGLSGKMSQQVLSPPMSSSCKKFDLHLTDPTSKSSLRYNRS